MINQKAFQKNSSTETGVNIRPFDIISPTTIIEKINFRDICDSKISWNKTLRDWIVKKCEKWENKLPTKVNISRTINLSQEVLEMIDIHVFGDIHVQSYGSHLEPNKDKLQANQDCQKEAISNTKT